MVTKLNQVVAAAKGAQTRAAEADATLSLYARAPHLFAGQIRTYEPKHDDGVQEVPEVTRVQAKVPDLLADYARRLGSHYDADATRELGNCSAIVDVFIEGQDDPILTRVPVAHLLFLERELAKLRRVFASLPTLDPTKHWDLDEASGLWQTEPTEKLRRTKESKPITLYDATEHHPAQVELVPYDAVIGTWTEIYQSGALQPSRVQQLVDRVDALIDGVKRARQRANGIEVEQVREGKTIFDYLLAD